MGQGTSPYSITTSLHSPPRRGHENRQPMRQNRKAKLLSRRDFLKAALAGTGGLVIASCDQGTPVPTPNRPHPATAPNPTPNRLIYSDPTRPFEERVNRLVSQMKIE